MTHIFIVDNNTFKYHLEYMFAGTGGSRDASFLFDNKIQMHWKSEASVIDMISDISRIRSGDRVIFYVQAHNGVPGKFYGVFKAKGTPFYDSNSGNYLYEKLHKNLNFRIEIEPDIVFSEGVSEHIALDILEGINHPSEMCWSLIYRKLRANRGCTMITDYEAYKLIEKIKAVNLGDSLKGTAFSYDYEREKIIAVDELLQYDGVKYSLSVTDRMLMKYRSGNAFEAHLQAYIVQNCFNTPLSEFFHINVEKPTWIGNEVACGVGMQRIDIAMVQEDDNSATINIVELKGCEPYNNIITYQLAWYVNWVINYWCPLYIGKKVIINPMVIAKKTSTESSNAFRKLADALKSFSKDNIDVSAVEYIAFEIDEDISFEKTF